MLRFFENLIDPYPQLDADHPQAQIPPASFWGFIRYSLHGLGKHFAVLILLTAMIAALEALLFGFLGRIVDWLANVPPAQLWQQEGRTLLLLALAIVSIPALTAMHAMLQMQALNGNLPMRLRWVYHNLMLRQSMGFYQGEFSGRVAAKVMQTALAVRDMCNILCDVMVFVVVYFVTLVTLVGQFHPLMLLPFALWLLAYAVSLSYFIPRLARISQQQADARSLMTGRVTDAYANIHTVKLFSHAGRESRYAQGAMREFMHTVYRQMRMVSGLNISNNILSFGLIAGATGLALWLWSHEQITVGAVAAAYAMTLRLNGMAHWFMFESAMLFEHVGTVRDGMGMLSQPNKVVDAPGAQPLHVSRGEVRFENIHFVYDAAAATKSGKALPAGAAADAGAGADGSAPARKEVIRGLNLTLQPGEKIGLVGPSGAGKSTLANLLLRFYELETGRICIDGQDIRHVTQDSLRQSIGMVTQDTALLHRTIRENILYGRPDASEAEMIEAARRAQAHDFIQTLSDGSGGQGYSAQVGERGVKLSGGQRQRIAIARAILKNAPILVLDEATSALDSESEALIQKSLETLMKNRTSIVIAHRLSTIAKLDRIIVLENGRIVEDGTHDQLLAKKRGVYAKLWARQSGGFIEE